uniref:MYND-type domain-containing protein n=1 Tax=Strigamia maritima TaxID=126957 RepID=T1J229_STRMM
MLLLVDRFPMASLNEDKINFIKLKYVLIPRASNILRQLFRKKWLTAHNSSWAETDEQGQQFIEGSGKKIFVTASYRRKRLLQSRRTDLWDLQLLSTILLKFDFGNGVISKQEKTQIQLLAVIHTDFRRSSNWINREEFDVTWKNIATILVKLGDSQDKVRSMEMKSPPPSSPLGVDVRQIELLRYDGLRNRGNKLYKEQKFIDAVVMYTQCIRIERCKIELALLYSNRSAAYIGTEDEFDILLFVQKMEMAKNDIKNAIELCPTWYKAHYRMGCFYQKVKINNKAAKHFEIALILDPSKIQIRKKLDQVKALIKPEDLDIEYTKEEFRKEEIVYQMMGRSHYKAWKGVCYLRGIEVLKDYGHAAELLTEAVNDDNEFAMINLADMYLLGLGVRKDTKMHTQLLLRAAARPRVFMDGEINTDVIEAEYKLGFAYHKGIGIFADLEKAIMWYKKSSDFGCAKSPYYLGCLYSKGSGVKQDEEKAVAAHRGFVQASEALADYYLSHDFDPDAVLQWRRWFIAESKAVLETDSIFEENVDAVRETVDSTRISNWEAENGFSIGNLSIRDRRRRFVKGNKLTFDEFELEREHREWVTKCYDNLDRSLDDLIIDHYPYPFKLNVLIEFTSNTARRVLQAVICFTKVIKLLKTSTKLEYLGKISIINELSECLKIEPLVAHWDEHDRGIVAGIVDEFWHTMMLAYSVKSSFEIQTLTCYVHFHFSSFAEMKELLKAYIVKYPEELRLYSMVLLSLEDFEEGLKQADLELKKCPNNCELLLYRAKHVRGLGENMRKVIKAYEDFLAVAEPDHPEVPAAYYEMALAYSNFKMLHQHSAICDKVKDYYRKGLEAEKIQLPCFLPYRRNERFEMLSKIISGMECGAGTVDSELSQNSRIHIVRRLLRNSGEKLVANRKLKTTSSHSKSKKKTELKQHAPPQLAEIKLITFKEMDRTENHFYEDVSVSVTVVEDYFVTDGIQLLVEDENHDVMHAAIYNILMNETVAKRFAYGSKIVIMNPYMSTSSDGKPVLIVEDRKSLIFESGENSKLCRFCKKPNADKRCSKCQKAYYCSKECQKNDWKDMNHKNESGYSHMDKEGSTVQIYLLLCKHQGKNRFTDVSSIHHGDSIWPSTVGIRHYLIDISARQPMATAAPVRFYSHQYHWKDTSWRPALSYKILRMVHFHLREMPFLAPNFQ